MDSEAATTGLVGSGVEAKIASVGTSLARSIGAVLAALPSGPLGPVDLARSLGLGKVLTSRTLKALRNRDPLAVVYLAPGPEPLRRLLRSAARHGAPADLVADADEAVRQFELLIRQEAGDRSALDVIISAWLPEARQEFELRRKQSAFKAMSQLKGVMAETNLATVMVHPNPDGRNLDVVWVSGLLGLHRLRPRVGVKFATRRITNGDSPRRPTSLDGVPVDDLIGVRLDDFCSSPPPRLEIHRVGEVVHYTLADHGFGLRSAVDLVFAEVNLAELARFVPAEKKRKAYFFAEIGTPTKTLHFDVFVHEDVYPGSSPQMVMYDTALDGVADVNDPARDIDRLEMGETVRDMGQGAAALRTGDVPDYASLIRLVGTKMSWDLQAFRGYRCRIDYPIYGCQVAMTFDPPGPPGTS
jgi:hypothetical protein